MVIFIKKSIKNLIFFKKGESNMEETIGEQPQNFDENVQKEIVDGGTALSSNEGSLGKFKDAESMLSSYNNLQAEFTRKCQKLSEVTKALEEYKNQVEIANNEKPIYENENWNNMINEFLQKNEKAKSFSSDIASEIFGDPELAKSKNALDIAWARVMEKNFVSKDEIMEDENFVNEKILSNPKIQSEVLENYFNNLRNTQNPPVISRQGAIAGRSEFNPKNMAEARALVEELFRLKGN